MGTAKRSRPSLREQWGETTNREAVILLPLLAAFIGAAVYAFLFTDSMSLSWWATHVAVAVVTVVGVVMLSMSVGYRPTSVHRQGSGQSGSLWHISSAATLVGVEAGNVVALDVDRCRTMSRMWDRSRPWGSPRRAVYFFGTAPTRAAAVANVSGRRRRDAVLLELDPSGVREPCYRRAGAIASTAGYRGRVLSVTRFDVASTSDANP